MVNGFDDNFVGVVSSRALSLSNRTFGSGLEILVLILGYLVDISFFSYLSCSVDFGKHYSETTSVCCFISFIKSKMSALVG